MKSNNEKQQLSNNKKKKDMEETFRDKNILRWFEMIDKQNVFLRFTLVGK